MGRATLPPTDPVFATDQQRRRCRSSSIRSRLFSAGNSHSPAP